MTLRRDSFNSISLEDVTLGSGFRRAPRAQFRENNPMLANPSLQCVLDWIDAQTPEIRKALNKMRENPGTKQIMLHARFPIGTDQSGLAFHQTFEIPADGTEMDQLK